MALLSLQEPLFTAEQVAKFLGLSVQTLYNMRLRGEGPVAHKFGGRSGPLRYQKADIDKWLEQKREVEK